ncbi:deoxycytidylate deaminase [Chromobacterium haemolyticum]|uniref:deoxycytidylate deaminase n=1 Tax=Chromobacterium haemolyticum TaxID=394935 RepID=UPI000AB1439E|nr:deoxycytidylate deaminase [Chromobacterium haemolyticum]
MDNYNKEIYESLYQERDDFILLGLTGWTGSGCSTAAQILSNERFDSIKLPDVNLLSGNEKRKALIVYNYARSQWTQFTVISVSAVLTMFLLDVSVRARNFFLKELELASFRRLFEDFDAVGFKRLGPHEQYEKAFQLNDRVKRNIELSEYTKLYQAIGNKVRAFGTIDGKVADGSAIQRIPKRIAQVVNAYRKASSDSGVKKNYYVIDAIRNPFEASYFKDRFSAFYLVGITVDDSVRRARLLKKDMDYSSVARLDFKEGAPIDSLDVSKEERDKLKESADAALHGKVASQNVSACLGKCDIYLSNPDESYVEGRSNPAALADKLITYVSLMRRPGLITPTSIERCMQIAITAKLNSGCLSRQVGAVVTDDNYSVLSIGWNDVARGQVPCLLRNAAYYLRGHDLDAYSKFELENEGFQSKVKGKYIAIVQDVQKKGRVFSYCFKDVYNKMTGIKNQVHTRALHAEENAFLQLATRGGGAAGGCLFTTASPCELCSKKSYQIGVKRIYYIDPYPGIATSNILESGTRRPDLILFTGAVGRAYQQLYDPVMPYKDEMELFV